MADIKASMVKALRGSTGAGMMDCKIALVNNDGDMKAATDWLRAKGLAKAARKASRIAAEGLVAAACRGKRGAVVEVNSETDFVARNDTFKTMVSRIAMQALDADGDIETLKSMILPETGRTVTLSLTDMVASIGENMSVRRTAMLEVGEGVVASYVHNQLAEGLGRIGVLVALESTADPKELAMLGRQLAMHVAAANPLALGSDDLGDDVIERERAIVSQQARDSGKPWQVVERMVEGRLRKFHEEVVFLKQIFVINGKDSVEKIVEAKAVELGHPIRVTGFARFALGEGIAKEQ
ncbi:MAG: translation elongation factor Ts [Hyphomicrobiales bacterium]